jgi:hypothetical protein
MIVGKHQPMLVLSHAIKMGGLNGTITYMPNHCANKIVEIDHFCVAFTFFSIRVQPKCRPICQRESVLMVLFRVYRKAVDKQTIFLASVLLLLSKLN